MDINVLKHLITNPTTNPNRMSQPHIIFWKIKIKRNTTNEYKNSQQLIATNNLTRLLRTTSEIVSSPP